jgi:phage shock protein PspC (stress-responsive transcriptional regulator)
MEKTIQITIASTVFSLTDSAYARLSAYLETLKARFAEEPGRDEIVSDIESRIAEKLLHKKSAVITEGDIAAVISEIGEASEIDEENTEPLKTALPGRKRLYRNMDEAYLGGVCAGIAAYFDIDALWVRLLTILITFMSGFGIVLYLLLWVLVPEAKSTSQKLEMQGKPVNLDTIVRIVKVRVEEVEKRGVLLRTGRAINRVITGVFGFAGRAIGVVISLLSGAALVGLTIVLGVILTNWNAPYNDFPLREAVSHPLLILGALIGYTAIVIPIVLIFSLGMRLLRKTPLIPVYIGIGLIGLWALCITALGVIGVKVAGEYYQYTQTNPAYIEISREIDLEHFDSVVVKNLPVTLRHGDSQRVIVQGRESEIDRAIATVTAGMLTLGLQPSPSHLCIFCSNPVPSVTIETPGIASLNILNASVKLEDISSESMHIVTKDSNVRGTIRADALTVESNDSFYSVGGSADSAEMSLRDTIFRGGDLSIVRAEVSAWDSLITVFVTSALDISHSSDSQVRNVAASEPDVIQISAPVPPSEKN